MNEERGTPTAVTIAARLVILAVVCCALYWGQVVFVPLALAVLLTFILTPPVMRLQRIGLPRVAAVIVVVSLVLTALAGLGWVVGNEVAALAMQLPRYRTNIIERIEDIRGFTRGGALEKVQATIEDISEDIERDEARSAQPKPVDDEPLLVEVTPSTSLVGNVERFLPVVESATTAGLALLLTILMLIQREDVRNRIVGLAGQAALVTTTKAFAEAGQRISRYLLMQLIINATMGLAVGIGLYFIGVPYSALWGFAAAVLRYIPYVGPWIAALFPIGITLISAPDPACSRVVRLPRAPEQQSHGAMALRSERRAIADRRDSRGHLLDLVVGRGRPRARDPVDRLPRRHG